ncbi:hypothetical protein JQS43_05210 [Natronosporangium hydrolyticum]|uniref:DUF2157 domain-containing protein n=1 Tax=Natronosporangium hydrolyticum TaxID=2811111 RepID=A0A895YNN8_9ACTN|nr:hypothetical protein [Natronosporangium hydrolyticum]QSB15740.1 hypothetical protein JQS43_05210 [Natronosporangium hydrolyticum]
MTEQFRATPGPAAYPCPVCRAPADLDAGCSGCGRPPDPIAAAVIQATARVAELAGEEHRRWRGLAEVRQQLRTERSRRDALAAQVRAARGAAVPAGYPAGPAAASAHSPVPPPPGVPPAPVPPPPAVPPGRPGPELASRSVQTVLFVAGGWLLGIGAVVFVLVGWGRYGVVGQAATLAAATVIGLLGPALAKWRQLPATAETLAVVGMLVLLLDGYAAWQAGMVTLVAGSTWAGAVLAGVAGISLGYARLSGLVGLRFVALVLAQGSVPLLAATLIGRLDGLAAQSLGAAALALLLAAGNLVLVERLRRGPDPRPASSAILLGLGWLLVGAWLVLGGVLAGLVLLVPELGTAAIATGLLVGLVVVLVGTAQAADRTGWRQVVAAGAVLVPALAGARLAAVAVPEFAQLAAVVVIAGAAVATAGQQGWLARLVGPRPGRWVGGLVALGLLGHALLGQALGLLGSAGSALRTANDPARTELGAVAGGAYPWQLPVSVVVVAAASGWLLWAWPLARRLIAVAAVLLAAAAAAPQLGAVLLGPYSWLFQGWPGAPAGTGLFAGGGSVASGPAALGTGLLAGVTLLGGWLATRRWRTGFAAGGVVAGLALLVTLDWAQAPWPTVPAVSLMGGAAILVAAVRCRSGWWTLAGLGYGGVLAGAGLAGASPTVWSTVAALEVLAVAAVLAAVVARRQQLRVTGWVAAAGCQLLAWWVLVVSWQVTTVEAYTLPVAAIALWFGYLARRRLAGSSGLGSWLAYGPALAAAALPSLAVTVIDPSPGRRLLVGLAAVVVLLAGVRWRLQAPVVVGATVAILAALRELAFVWQRLDAWVPLTVAGALLLLLAATYERHRRELTRAAAALRRLG